MTSDATPTSSSRAAPGDASPAASPLIAPRDASLARPPWQFPPVAGWVFWGATFALGWVLLIAVRDQIEQVHAVLGFLLVVLGAAATGTRRLAFAAAVAGALAINYSFEEPYGTLFVHKVLDALIIVGFLAVALLASQLVSAARRRAEEARQRAREVELLAAERIRLIEEVEHARALQEAARAKDALLASVSHDLRTPLTTIITLAEQGRMRGEASGQGIEREARRLSHLVENVLEFSRIAAGAWPARLEATAAEEVLGSVERDVRHRLANHVLVVRVNGDDPLLSGWLDEALAVRVLSNLVENAIKYSPEGSTIRLEAAPEGEELVFSVSDEGPGIAKEDQQRVFEPFVRAQSVAPDVGGVGLGLAIARALAELQQGTLTVESRPGAGTRMLLRVRRAVLDDATGEHPLAS
ncbi:MAG: PAS domain-containing sensor histidine kinase [Gemmatimonadetes bacterium]|nr:PAS domain-containing sensor histidine kinase [Gemmatimonadota bacterium]